MAKSKKCEKGNFRQTFVFNGKRYDVRAKSLQELAEKLTAKKTELENGVNELKNPTLDSYYEYFTEIRRNEIKESTLRSQRIQYNLISKVDVGSGLSFGQMRIKEITRRNIEAVRLKLLNEGSTPQYLNICFAHLSHVFNTAVLDDTIEKNPCKALKRLRRNDEPIGENKHRALTETETKRFFEMATKRNSYYLNFFKVMIMTGLRIGELTALYRTDIDHAKGFIYVRRTITRDEVGGFVVGEDAKTKSGVRDVPMNEAVYTIIRNQEEMNRMIFGLDSGLLFRSVEGAIVREYSVNREIKRICTAANIKPFTCHAFRNTFATRFIEQNPQAYKFLSDILGHKDISITLNLYTHVMQDKKVEAMNAVDIKIS